MSILVATSFTFIKSKNFDSQYPSQVGRLFSLVDLQNWSNDRKFELKKLNSS